ncbi:MAG: diacylglycerol kinase [bacterium]|nr:diacylglycerol kinase [bacterium]
MSKTKSFAESVDLAIQGIISAFKAERNFRLDILFAGIVILCGILLNLTRIEIAILFFVITLVLFTELFNTAIEKLLDIVNDKFDPKIKFIKDVSAGAVLITVIASVAIGYLVFYPHLDLPFRVTLRTLRSIPYHLIVGGIILVIISVIVIKSLVGDKFLRGGIVSGHSAVAFSLAVAIVYLSNSLVISILGVILALMVAQSRVEGKIHSLKEVIFGSFLGIIVMLTIFKLLLK